MRRRAMGILFVNDILDEHRIFTNLFGKGDSIVWGGLGWVAFLLYIIFVGCLIFLYLSKKLRLIHTRAVCVSEKESYRERLGREMLKIDEIQEKYEEEKIKIIKKLRTKEEQKKSLDKNLLLRLKNAKKVAKDTAELTSSIKDLEEDISKLEKQRKKEIRRRLKTCNELQKKAEECEEQIKETERELKENKDNFIINIKKSKVVHCVIVFIILTDGNNMIVTAQEVKNTLAESFDLSEESQVNEPETGEPVSEDVTPEVKDKNTEILHDIETALREHMDYNFILEDGQLHGVMDDDIEDIIFLRGYSEDVTGYKEFLTNCREGSVTEILPEVNDDGEIDLDELLNEIAEGLERPFLGKISDGKMIQTQTEWEQSAAKSSELENIMDQRWQALGMEESISVRRTTYFLLANDYQRMGNECLIQRKDGTQIYYNYGMSIYCCYCALGYEMSGENAPSDEDILNYVKARYKDIIDNEKMGIPIKKVNSAEKIYSLLNM